MTYYASTFAKRQPMSDRLRSNPYADQNALKRQKDEQMWASVIPTIGSAVGTVAGGALGSLAGPGGTMAGATLGGQLGGAAGNLGGAALNQHAQEETDPQRLREMQRAALMQALQSFR